MPIQPKLDVETQMQIVLESPRGATVAELCRRYGGGPVFELGPDRDSWWPCVSPGASHGSQGDAGRQ